jgi:hypothetical protein
LWGFEAALDILKKRYIYSLWQIKIMHHLPHPPLDGSMAAQCLSCFKQYDQGVIINLNLVIKLDNFD